MLRSGLLVAAVVAALDQLSKWVIVGHVMRPPRVIEVTGFFDLVLHWNKGISFGLFHTDSDIARWILVAVAVVIVAGLVWWLRRIHDRFLAMGLGLVIGGAVGNVIDRLNHAAVADFLSFHLGPYYWPAFNLADSAITIGVAMILVDALFARPRSRK